jgi:hypothetical protein
MGLITSEHPDMYTGEVEPRGAKHWVPLTKDGHLIKSNVKKILRAIPSTVWVYEQTAMDHLANFDWPSSKLKYAEGVIPKGRWRDYRPFKPGVHDI